MPTSGKVAHHCKIPRVSLPQCLTLMTYDIVFRMHSGKEEQLRPRPLGSLGLDRHSTRAIRTAEVRLRTGEVELRYYVKLT